MASPASTDASTSSRDKILDTAEPLFARSGFAGVGLREVAEQVGMGKSSLFHHFPSKVQLYVAVLERVFHEFDQRLELRASQDEGPLAQLHGWATVVVGMLAEHPNWAALLLRSLFEGDVIGREDQARIDVIFSRIVARISSALQAGIASNEIRPVSIPHTIQTMVGMTVFHFASGDMGDDLLGEPIYSQPQLQARLSHLHDYIDHALATRPLDSPT